MPKIKTNRSAAKRFRRTKNGQFKRQSSCRRHLMTSKTGKRVRQLRKSGLVSEADRKVVARMLPYA